MQRVALLASAAVAHAYKAVEEVPGATRVAEGQATLKDVIGREWDVVLSEQHKRVYFHQKESKQTIWTHPRDLVLTGELPLPRAICFTQPAHALAPGCASRVARRPCGGPAGGVELFSGGR